ncbi:MAG: [citrate (pro-3S)-lyase] ligase [Anaerococcus sp.]|nr:[citrate (pro-3S)-lyase] ligase [Anaerococcus sp.]
MEKIYPDLIASDKEKLKEFLKNHNLAYEENIESTYVLREEGKIVASGSRSKNIIKSLAINDSYQGSKVINELISLLINEIHAGGFDNIFIYTKPSNEETFTHLGFKKIEEVPDKLVFMERSDNFSDYLAYLDQNRVDVPNPGAVVINANPLTLGHLSLIDYGLSEVDFLYVFLVSEDASFFSSKDRLKIVKEALYDKKRVKILTTDDYLVSKASFPSYFLDEDEDVTKIYTKLDAYIFKNHIGKRLGIKKRFVGDEKEDKTTNIYNQTMAEIFIKEPNPIDLVEIERKKINGQAISASRVRKLIKEKSFDKLEDLVPKASLRLIEDKFK